MYARKITFTLLAPSIWPVIEAVGKTHISDDYRRCSKVAARFSMNKIFGHFSPPDNLF